LEIKQRKITLGLRELIVDHLIRKDRLLGEEVFNFQIGHLPSTIIIRSLKKIKCTFSFSFFDFKFFEKNVTKDANTSKTYF
jgi:hypothetical protein